MKKSLSLAAPLALLLCAPLLQNCTPSGGSATSPSASAPQTPQASQPISTLAKIAQVPATAYGTLGATHPLDVGYDIIVIAGQSNAVGWGAGGFNDPAQDPNTDAQIRQIGRYNGHNLQNIAAIDCLDHHPSWNNGSWASIAGSDCRKGFGMPFARRYVKSGMLLPGRQVLIVPAAAGSTGSWQWQRGAGCAQVTTYDDNTPLYCDMLNRIHWALAQPGRNQVIALLWAQGEADVDAINPSSPNFSNTGSAANYISRVSNIFQNLRSDLGNQGSFPILMGQMVPSWPGWVNGADGQNPETLPVSPYRTQIAQAIIAISKSAPNIMLASVDNLQSNYDVQQDTNPAMLGAVHFSAQAQEQLGERLYNLFAAYQWPFFVNKMLLSPLVFDWRAYLILNPALVAAGVLTEAQAQTHWLNYGAQEGRRANGAFDVKNYLGHNPILGAYFGTNYWAATLHYVIWGYSAGLLGFPSTSGFGGVLPNVAGFSGNAAVGNGIVEVTTSSQFAGAIDGVYFGGRNFVNNHDHGRQIQMAAWNDGMGECNNPNEAGWASDQAAPTSHLTSIAADATGISTSVEPAYYLRNGENSPNCPSVVSMPPPQGQTISKDPTFSKKISLNVNGDPQIFMVSANMNLAAPITSTIYEPAFVALNSEFSSAFEMNLNHGYNAITYPSTGRSGSRPVILSTAKGDYAMGVFSPSMDGTHTVYYGTYNAWNNPNDPTNDTVNLSVAYAYPAPGAASPYVQGLISQKTYFVVGSLSDVQAKLKNLVILFQQ